MANKFKHQYTAFQRHILAEFMTTKELNEMDLKYNEAKVTRVKRNADEMRGIYAKKPKYSQVGNIKKLLRQEL